MLGTGNKAAKQPAITANDDLVRCIVNDDPKSLIEKEWLVTNGLGGYASGTIAGAPTRRYHGLLIAAHPAPLGRIMLLSHLGEQLQLADGRTYSFDGMEHTQHLWDITALEALSEFRFELGLPVWRYVIEGYVLEKRIYMCHLQNTVHINYRVIEGEKPIQLKLRVAVQFRGHDDHVSTPHPHSYALTCVDDHYELTNHSPTFPALRMKIHGHAATFTSEETAIVDIFYRVEAGRGYDCVGGMSSPGFFQTELSKAHEVTLTASTDSWERVESLSPQDALEVEIERRHQLNRTALQSAQDDFAKELVLAADQFIISPASRVKDIAQAQASGEQARTIVAGYHWFTDWGRDTMISLEGLTLVTGRHHEAAYILHTFINHMRDGLIPNFFPDRSTDAVYHTADATLWYFHALSRYMALTSDRSVLRTYLPILKEIIGYHQRGTRFGIGVDPEDGLLRQGATGYQLTWMDAKVGDWVVTPRRGKAVEINALWYNALRLMESWTEELHEDSAAMRSAADRAYVSFNKRFWCEAQQGLYDVIDGEQGDDASCRPNQILSVSLPNPILDQSRWNTVLDTVQERLLTPFGLRSLAPGHPDYKPQYYGDLRSRDAAYHQGTVWAWLIGPFADAWLRVHPDRVDDCRGFIEGFESHLNESCIGTISEIFDAEAPYTPRGCAAQAWSVAEVLRISSRLSNGLRTN